ncbi:MAG TPA: hypothetical protein IAC67_01210 [Candidatus Coproplasma excrementipullorum]|nr:hypothetical protein [Candidatus Coproplasma excrementipullorum]
MDYANQRDIPMKLLAQQMGVSTKYLYKIGDTRTPTARTIGKIALAMTELGAPTTSLQLFAALNEDEGSALGGSNGHKKDNVS